MTGPALVAAVSALLGMFMPGLVAVVVKAQWPSWAKEVTALGSSLLVGAITAWGAGQLHSGLSILEAGTILWVAGQAAYVTLWRNSAIGQALEKWAPVAQVVNLFRPKAAPPA